ncbi:hypothetical protein CLU79DRAFT_413519 [Phycomyces nitens]|nr:hypothetical protein CLU79DRAFT_413519 [Phycomyces nitens]
MVWWSKTQGHLVIKVCRGKVWPLINHKRNKNNKQPFLFFSFSIFISLMLPPELILRIVDMCLDNELELHSTFSKHPRNPSCVYSLLQTNTQLNHYVSHHPLFHRLRLFRVFNRILLQKEPRRIAICTPQDWTIIKLDITIQRIQGDQQELFLLAEEVHVYKKSQRWTRDADIIFDKNEALMSFDYHAFVDDLCNLAYQNSCSVWLWKSSPSFFKGDNIRVLTHKPPHPTVCKGRCWNCHFIQFPKAEPFRLVAEDLSRSLMAWDRPTEDHRQFTKDVLRCNIEMFGSLLQDSWH